MKKQISSDHQRRLENIGCYLCELRFSEGLTQKEVGTELNLHTNSISRIENGHNMTLISILELCYFYGIPPSELLNII